EGPHRPGVESLATAAGRGGETVVLHGHVGQQVGQRPAGTGRRPVKVGGGDRGDHGHARAHRAAVHFSIVHRHALIICPSLSSVKVYVPGMDGRPDLAAMITVLGRGLIAMEQPVLREHDLSMWAYAVLLRL